MATGQEPADLPASGARTEAGAPAAKHRGAGEHGEPRFGFAGYAAMLTVGTLCWSFLSIYLWSSMFIDAGESSHPYALLRENYWLSNVFLSVGLLLGITLYVLDVFMPPHLRGQHGALWNNDRCVGRALLVLVVLLFLVGCLFMAAYYPHFPMLIFIALGMVIPASVRLLTLPQRADGAGRGARELGRRESKLSSLKALVQKSDDALKFYQAFAFAYFYSSVAVAFAWAVQVGSGQICFSGCDNQFTVVSDSCGDSAADGLDSGLVVFLAMSPLFVAFANLVFGLFALVRVVMNSTYLSTSRHRNQLATALRVNPEALERNEVLLELSPAPSENAEPRPSGGSEPTREVSEEFQSMELKSYQQLTMLVKAVGFMLILLIGLSYAGALLVWADNEIASMFCSLLVVFFIGFILMTVFSFSRIAHVLGNWLIDLPLWGHVLNFMKNDWVQAFTLCIVFPLLLPFAVLCITNQRVRSLRGISGFVDQDAVDSAALSTVDPDDPAVPAADPAGMRAFLNELNHLLHPTDTQPDSPLRFWVTARVHGVWQKIRNLRWLSIYTKVYIWCLLPFSYYVGSLVFNAGFAYLRYLLTPVSFGLVLGLTFVIGVCAFLWPTVPGMVVYMFGGLLIPDTCPFPADGSREARFWVGVCINFVLGFFLKLSACAIQQKLIGGQLGTNITVRQLCRVHTPEMRTVESVLKQPGLSVGKVAILCGGPDWPTSVLCGIMGLSLWSCEVGTTPIIFYIIPCALCGSAYLRASESAEWEATASAMVFATTIITGLLWVIMAWAVQREWEQKGEELGKPLRQHGDLWFLDHKADTLQKRCAVGWNELPRTLRNCFAAGALIQIVANWCLVQAYYYLFGDFTVSEDWENIEWYAGTMDQCGCYAASGTVERDYCVFAAGGIAVTVIYLLGWMPYKALYRYWARRNVQIKEEIDQELDEEYQRRWSVAFFQVGHLGEDVDVAMAALALQERARRQLRGAARAGQLLPAVRRVLEASRGPVEEPDGGEGERGPVAVSAAPKRQWADPEHGAARSLEQLDRRLDGQGARAKMFPLLHWCSLCNSSGSFIEFGEGEASPQNQVAERDVSRDFPV